MSAREWLAGVVAGGFCALLLVCGVIEEVVREVRTRRYWRHFDACLAAGIDPPPHCAHSCIVCLTARVAVINARIERRSAERLLRGGR